jgi:tripartite-type tricarboxylate transporter receptor subunit TctC
MPLGILGLGMRTPGLRLAMAVVLAAIVSTEPASPQGWPQRPVRIIVPFAPGGNSDDVARLMAQHLGETFGQQFVVENRPGASGAIAAEAVARSPADGYTLLLASLPLIAIMPATTKTSFDPVRDFVPVSAVATNPLVLAVDPRLAVRSLADFVAYARDRRGQLTYAAAGIGSITHLAMALFLKRADIDMTAVMYKGGASNLTDVIAGRVTAGFPNISTILPFAAGDLLRPLAVSSAQRAPRLANVPTFIESGYPGFDVINWTGLMAPAGTPDDVVRRIARDVAQATKDAKIVAPLTANGADPLGNTPEEFAAMIAAEIPLWAEAVKVAGVGEK